MNHDSIMQRLEKAEALAELSEQYRRERDQLREQVATLNANVDTFLAELKQVKSERDEARREADRFRHGCTVEGDFVCPNEYAVSELTAERNFLRALKKNHEEDFTRICKERDEARAEVQEHREQLRKLPDANRVSNQAAYRRGAEAMRERCEELVKHNSHEDGIGMGSQRIEGAIRALPIPEEP